MVQEADRARLSTNVTISGICVTHQCHRKAYLSHTHVVFSDSALDLSRCPDILRDNPDMSTGYWEVTKTVTLANAVQIDLVDI